MSKEIILEGLTRALESWARNASATQLWSVHQSGGLGALIEADEEVVQVRIVLGGARDVLSDLGRTDGRLPVTEAFLGAGAWGAPPAQGGLAREQWFLSSELAQVHARQYLVAEVGERRDLLERCVDAWIARQETASWSRRAKEKAPSRGP
ncbi:hypothetical protein [Variovorax sp. Root411]|uniref:hypothetical protein n=1 Tax=Variovorax sp. Root411 TaxID=1736530 RepID=UPI0006F2C05A|nr:hypothetical protein [Variovorax sp. Root411]KQW64483.1 hypothetical protein ASC92_03295 [Variovorax sp. Root411]